MSDARTTYRLHHSAVPKPDPIPTPTPRTPASAYARCDDCGTSAGEPCYDSHDRPCAPCPGRVLAPSASYVKRERAQRSSPAAKPPKPRPPPWSNKCEFCGASMRSNGTYCNDTACQHEKFRLHRAKAASRAAPLHPCMSCGVEVGARRKYCDAKMCQHKRVRAYLDASPPVRKPRGSEGLPPTAPRLWVEVCMSCGGPTNFGGSYCGAVACRAARKRDRRDANRQPVHCLGCQCQIKRGAKWCLSDECKAKRRDARSMYDKARNDTRKIEVVLSGVEVLCGCGRRLLGLQKCRRCRRIEEQATPVCPGCHAPQSHTRHCSDLCAQISDLYLRSVRSRSTTPRETEQHRDA
jgi:hypothetical protein